jgi:hypothetical protein
MTYRLDYSAVTDRFNQDKCWAGKRVYIGQLFPSYVRCTKQAQLGKLTCHWHKRLEADAQKLKKES